MVKVLFGSGGFGADGIFIRDLIGQAIIIPRPSLVVGFPVKHIQLNIGIVYRFILL